MQSHTLTSAPARWPYWFVGAIGVVFAVTVDALEMRDITLRSVLYSEVTLTATVTYDGALGDSVMFGATALGDGEVRGTGFRPTALDKGTSRVTFSVSRPEVAGLEQVVSGQLQLMVYNREAHREARLDFVIEWPGFKQHFMQVKQVKLDGAVAAQPLTNLRSATLNERLDAGSGLVQALVALGVAPEQIELSALDLPVGLERQVALVLPETIAADDLGALLGVLRGRHIGVTQIEFVSLDAKDFRHGHVKFVPPGAVAAPPLPSVLLDRLAHGSPPAVIFAHYGIKSRSKAELSTQLLNKAIALNDLGTRVGGVEAEKILSELVAVNYRNPRVYEQLARAYSRIGGMEETAEQQRAALAMSLQRFPNNHWAHAYLVFLESELGNYQEALKQLALARKHAKEPNIWLIVYGGRLHHAVGDYALAAQTLKPLLTLKDLSASDDRARYYGMVAYAEALREMQPNEVAAAYAAIISAYPERGACNKLDLARHLLMHELDTARPSELLDHADTRTCRGAKQLRALVALLEWQRAAVSRQALSRVALDYGEMADLILQAAQFKNADSLLAALADHGIALDIQNRYGYTALHMAAQQGRAVAVSSLVRAGAALDLKSGDGLTPLMLAVTSNRVEPVRALLAAGADPYLKSGYGFTARELANSFDNPAVIDLLAGKSNIAR